MQGTPFTSTDGLEDIRLVLLIDDSVDQRDLYELALEDEFTVLTAARGREGVAVARRARPDVIVLDVMMPGMDGWETCARLKSAPETAHIPVVMLTGAPDGDLREHAAAVGAFEVLTKPCSVDRLRGAILAALGG
jgi:CheY-like chemotaxis protein